MVSHKCLSVNSRNYGTIVPNGLTDGPKDNVDVRCSKLTQ